MARMVNLEGRQVPDSQIPDGSLFIQGCWYSSANKLPPNLRNNASIVSLFTAEKDYKDKMKAEQAAIVKRQQRAKQPIQTVGSTGAQKKL